MREPFGATPGPEGPEPAGAQSASGAAPTGDTTSCDAARMEQAIDLFIQHDRENRPEDDRPEPGAPAFDALARHGETGIVDRLAPLRRDDPERLPRIVTSSLPIRPPPLPGDDRWRRQFIGALRNADDVPMAPAIPPPLPRYARTAPAGNRRNLPEHDSGQQRRDQSAERSPFAARWHAARRVFAAATAMTCLFSTGALWATHRSVMVAELGGQPARAAALQAASTAGADATPDQPIRNTPVLIREGETVAHAPAPAAKGWRHAPPAGPSMASASGSAPIVSRIVNVGEPPPAVPIAPVVRVVPVVPIDPAAQIVPAAPIASAEPIASAAPIASVDAATEVATNAPDRSMADSVAPMSSKPPLDRDGLTERAARPAETPPIVSKPPHRVRPARSASVGRISGHPSRSRRPAVARSQVPVDGWVMRRQSLRSEPEPEPSTLKKLISLVWPSGKSSTAAEPSKPAAPAVTKPVQSWSDSVRANP